MRYVMTGHTILVKSVAMSVDGKRTVPGSRDQTVRVWVLKNGAQIDDALCGHAGEVERLAMNEDGVHVL